MKFTENQIRLASSIIEHLKTVIANGGGDEEPTQPRAEFNDEDIEQARSKEELVRNYSSFIRKKHLYAGAKPLVSRILLAVA